VITAQIDADRRLHLQRQHAVLEAERDQVGAGRRREAGDPVGERPQPLEGADRVGPLQDLLGGLDPPAEVDVVGVLVRVGLDRLAGRRGEGGRDTVHARREGHSAPA
jgi:hypothetical protein